MPPNFSVILSAITSPPNHAAPKLSAPINGDPGTGTSIAIIGIPALVNLREITLFALSSNWNSINTSGC